MVECLPQMHEASEFNLQCHKNLVQWNKLIIQAFRKLRSIVQRCPQLHNEFEGNLCYLRPCLKKQTQQTITTKSKLYNSKQQEPLVGWLLDFRNPQHYLYIRALLLAQRTGNSWAPWCCHHWPVPDGREVLSLKCTLSVTENRWERGAQKCLSSHKYFMLLNQMEKTRLLLFQMEVAETSSHLRLIGTLLSDYSMETKKEAAKSV